MRAVLLAGLFLVVVVVVGAADNEFTSFTGFVQKYNKVYSSIEEFEARFAVFKRNLGRIETFRAQHQAATGESGDDVYGVTKFADLSKEEFESMYMGFRGTKSALHDGAHVVAPNPAAAPPKSFDWRNSGAVTPVKDQGLCGSCWAFSATEEIESMNFRQGNALVSLSVQQIVSCDNVDMACNGGDTPTAYQYVEKAGGLELDSNYPYQSGDGNDYPCTDSKSKHVVGVSNFSYATPPCTDSCNNQNETTLLNNLYSVGPVSICVYAEPWQLYTGGILSSGCTHSYSSLDHCVQLVGYDQTGSTPYWIIRNSWNTDWGIDGYIWVKMGSNLCGVADEATVVQTFTVSAQ